MYIHQNTNWPDFIWDNSSLITLLAEVRCEQGRILGRVSSLGFELQQEASLDIITLDIVKSSEIEGEYLDTDQVRSSVAKRLGLDHLNLIEITRYVDGIVEMMLDAVNNNQMDISQDRLFGWHNCLFPTGRSGLYKINVAKYRDDLDGPMQVISGGIGQEIVHFEAPSAELLTNEMNQFFQWANSNTQIDQILKAAIVHLWFVTIHPFDDGNGRIARALTDMFLARADGVNQRFYSMSSQIQRDRKSYYKILELTQRGDLDITHWLIWFLKALKTSMIQSNLLIDKSVKRQQLQYQMAKIELNTRQIKMLDKMIEGFEGPLTTSKWAKICQCSNDSALRDINDLIKKEFLNKGESGGRSAHYFLK